MLIIGITGGTGCGKTTVVNQIINELPENEVGVISQDSYYNDLLAAHLEALKKGNSIEQPEYSFVAHNRTKNTVKTQPRKVMIVEGILIMSHPELRDLFDIKIFVHADSDERLMRRLKRDLQERGRNLEEVLNRYQTTLKPMHDQFIEPAKEFADIIIPNNHYNTVAVDIVRTIINDKLN